MKSYALLSERVLLVGFQAIAVTQLLSHCNTYKGRKASAQGTLHMSHCKKRMKHWLCKTVTDTVEHG